MPVTAAATVPFSIVVTANPMPVLKLKRANVEGGSVITADAGSWMQNTTAVVPSTGVVAALKNSMKATAAVPFVSENPYRFPGVALRLTAAPVALMNDDDSVVPAKVEGRTTALTVSTNVPVGAVPRAEMAAVIAFVPSVGRLGSGAEADTIVAPTANAALTDRAPVVEAGAVPNVPE